MTLIHFNIIDITYKKIATMGVTG